MVTKGYPKDVQRIYHEPRVGPGGPVWSVLSIAVKLNLLLVDSGRFSTKILLRFYAQSPARR